MKLLLAAAMALFAVPAVAQQLPFSSTDTAISENFEWLAAQNKKNAVAIESLQNVTAADATSYFTTPVQISTSIAGQLPNAAPRANTIYSDNQIRAWAIIVGTGTVWSPASFNVSSLIDSGTGAYTIVFATPMLQINGYDSGTGQYVPLCTMYRTDVTNNDTCGAYAGGTTYFGLDRFTFNASTEGGTDQDGIVFGVILGGKQ